VVEPGRRCLGDRYELQQLIATGGMGQVWRGLDTALGRPVAVKVLRSEYTGDPTFLARFRAEAQHTASLNHPNIACVFDYGEETVHDGTGETLAYLVMELVDGEPLSSLLRREGPLDAETTLSLLRQTAFGLAEAHRAGLVHRDVKPGNLLVRNDGTVKITDFGIAWSARSVALTRTGQVIGTPQYLSPEQAEGKLATPASDIYALGLIGYECLSGHPAFDGDNAVTIALKQVRQHPEPLPDDLPAGVRSLINRALVKDPRARIPDGAAFVGAIEDVLDGRALPDDPAPTAGIRPVSALPPRDPASTTGRTGVVHGPPAQRRRKRVAVALLPLLGLLVGAGIAAVVLTLVGQEKPTATASAADTTQSQTFVLDAADYIGRPVNDVVRELSSHRLNVQRQRVPTEAADPGRVIGVQPDGRTLAPGDTVVVSYAVSPTNPTQDLGSAAPVTDAVVDLPTTAAAVTSAAPSTRAAPATRTRSSAPATTATLPGSSGGSGGSSSSAGGGGGSSGGGSSSSEEPPPSSESSGASDSGSSSAPSS
jgi:serine/threonine-protein kinase